jgi:phosphoglucosamine mutase
MKRRYFGTDGVRGRYGGPVVNDSFASRLGAAAARHLRDLGVEPGREVLIGRDTRESGAALERAVAAGLSAEGFAPVSLGVLPTPAVSRAVRVRGATLGVAITASHNPAEDNGIKFFDAKGIKLTDADECGIEEQMMPLDLRVTPPPTGASLAVLDEAASEYVAAATRLLAASSLKGWRVVLDTANGATFQTSPAVLRALGAEVIGLGDAPDGRNINLGVGSEHPELLCTTVRQTGARLGIAHDGDGDRCVLCDELGMALDGDEILTVLAWHALQNGTLLRNTLVVTVQSNLGLDAAVQAAGGRVLRTPVGDRYVSECMLAEGAVLGGESSGHIICAEVSPTGDGLVAALKVIGVMLATGRPLSDLRGLLRKFPQAVAAMTVGEKRPLEALPAVQAAIRAVEADLGGRGRVLVRYSGTESKIRLLVEGADAERVQAGLGRLQAAVRRDLPAG